MLFKKPYLGWTPGEGLGKEGTGSLTPLLLELKFDKRGLEANEEVSVYKTKLLENRFQSYDFPQVLKPKGQNNKGKKGSGKPGPIPMSSLQQKHPVSLLGELASKRRWGAPNYELVNEQGPAHAKSFLFKVRTTGKYFLETFSPSSFIQQVRLNGIDYTCNSTANNKKEAKSLAAKFCLQQLGILPS